MDENPLPGQNRFCASFGLKAPPPENKKDDSPEPSMDNIPPPGYFGKVHSSSILSSTANGPPGNWSPDANEDISLVHQAVPDSPPGDPSPQGRPKAIDPQTCFGETSANVTRPQGLVPMQDANVIRDVSGTNAGPLAGPPTPLLKELESIVNENHRPISIELCCGHAGLTASLATVGFQAIGFDWQGNRHETVVPIVTIDLTDEAGQQTIFDLLVTGRVKFVHMGPPCGTYTRARERRIPWWQRRRGVPDPKPLRSDKYPAGPPKHHKRS